MQHVACRVIGDITDPKSIFNPILASISIALAESKPVRILWQSAAAVVPLVYGPVNLERRRMTRKVNGYASIVCRACAIAGHPGHQKHRPIVIHIKIIYEIVSALRIKIIRYPAVIVSDRNNFRRKAKYSRREINPVLIDHLKFRGNQRITLRILRVRFQGGEQCAHKKNTFHTPTSAIRVIIRDHVVLAVRVFKE